MVRKSSQAFFNLATQILFGACKLVPLMPSYQFGMKILLCCFLIVGQDKALALAGDWGKDTVRHVRCSMLQFRLFYVISSPTFPAKTANCLMNTPNAKNPSENKAKN